jgi:hypothetical protein
MNVAHIIATTRTYIHNTAVTRETKTAYYYDTRERMFNISHIVLPLTEVH